MTCLPTEPHVILSIARATALAADESRTAAGTPAASGGTQGRPFGEVGPVQVPPTSDAIERAWP